MATDIDDLLNDEEFMNALSEASKSKDFGAVEKLIKEADVKKQLNSFMLDCRKYSRGNREKCDVCNLRFMCYTMK